MLTWIGLWVHTHTVTTTNIGPDLWESFLAEILGQVSVIMTPLHLVETIWPFRLQHTSISSIYRCLSTFWRCGQGYGCTLSMIRTHTFAQIWECWWLKSWVKDMCTLCQNAMVEDVITFQTASRMVSQVYTVFLHVSLYNRKLGRTCHWINHVYYRKQLSATCRKSHDFRLMLYSVFQQTLIMSLYVISSPMGGVW